MLLNEIVAAFAALTTLWLGGLSVVVLILAVQQGDLKRRLAAAEFRLAAPTPSRSSEPASAPAWAPSTVRPPAPLGPSAPSRPVPAPLPRPVLPAQAGRGLDAALQGAITWLQRNWFYAISAASLGLAGIFFAQYSIEKGLLPPVVRVVGALTFGLLLVAAGELIRRRWSDDESTSAAYLPSTFSSAGLITMYGAVLAALRLYHLIGTTTALFGLVAVAALGLALGWVYGPLLAAMGLIGATVAPFWVGGDADSAYVLYAYLGLVATVGLVVAGRRAWEWIAALSLALSLIAALVIRRSGGEADGFVVLLGLLAILGSTAPRWRLLPDHPAAVALRSRRLVPGNVLTAAIPWGTVIVVSLLLLASAHDGPLNAARLSLVVLAGLAAAFILGTERAPGLYGLAAVPGVAFGWSLTSRTMFLLPGRTAADWDLSGASVALVVALAVLVGGAALTRSLHHPGQVLWGIAAAAFLPLSVLIVHEEWSPQEALGEPGWAGWCLAAALVMTGFAAAYLRADDRAEEAATAPVVPNQRRYAAWSAIAALTLLGVALHTVLDLSGLTAAWAGLVVVAGLLDRRFRLPELGWFIAAMTAVLTARPLIGLPAGYYVHVASLGEVLLAYGSVILALLMTSWLLPELPNRDWPRAIVRAGVWTSCALLAMVLIERAMLEFGWDEGAATATLRGIVWAAAAVGQLYLWTRGHTTRWLSGGLAIAYGLVSVTFLLRALTDLNPWFGQTQVSGPLVLDSLLVAYGVPAALLFALAAFASWLPRLRVWRWVGAGWATLYVFLETRRFFHDGAVDYVLGFTQPELSTYTVLLLALGVTLLARSISTADPWLRHVAIAVLAVTSAKVFLIDIYGLAGLLRVFSFLGLGLVLAGLAWLNRWAGDRSRTDAAEAAAG